MITLVEHDDDDDTDPTLERRVRCVKAVMRCQEAQLRQVEDVLGFEDAGSDSYGAVRRPC